MKKNLEIYEIAPEIEALRMGMGFSKEDLKKPYVMIESTYGDSHPGSCGLDKPADIISETLYKDEITSGKFFSTDICDGIAQGHEGMNYSLPSREIIAALGEIHFRANPCEGAVFISSCDKAIPAHLLALSRIDKPALLLPGGVMREGRNKMTLEQVGKYNVDYKRGNLSKEQFLEIKKDACTTCGACQFMGTAGTMQVLAEALGIAPPFSALTPYESDAMRQNAVNAAKYLETLMQKDILPKNILTKEAFENAAVIFTCVDKRNVAFAGFGKRTRHRVRRGGRGQDRAKGISHDRYAPAGKISHRNFMGSGRRSRDHVKGERISPSRRDDLYGKNARREYGVFRKRDRKEPEIVACARNQTKRRDQKNG